MSNDARERVEECVRRILADLDGRSGIGNAFDAVDDEIKSEIASALAEIVSAFAAEERRAERERCALAVDTHWGHGRANVLCAIEQLDDAAEATTAKEELFYLQDSRGYVGNDMLWWRVESNGYTTDLREAATFTEREAKIKHNDRDTDTPWPKRFIDSKARPTVDFQYVGKRAVEVK